TARTVLAATDIGIFRTVDAGANWAPFNLGAIPAVAVFDLEQNLNGVVFAATHGRGIFQLAGEGAASTRTPPPPQPQPQRRRKHQRAPRLRPPPGPPRRPRRPLRL